MLKRCSKALGEAVSLTGVLCLGILSLTGCIFVVADRNANRVEAAQDALRTGVSRSSIMDRLGQPFSTETNDGKVTDTFLVPRMVYANRYYPQRQPGGEIFILEPFDAVLTPLALYFARDATKCAYKVTYDSNALVADLQCFYPKGYDPTACFGECPNPRV